MEVLEINSLLLYYYYYYFRILIIKVKGDRQKDSVVWGWSYLNGDVMWEPCFYCDTSALSAVIL